MSRILSVVSGKGGVGKSSFTANLGAALAAAGRSVLIVDTDIGLRAQDALLGLENMVVYDLVDAVSGDCLPEDALLEVPSVPGLRLLPAAQFARAKALEPKKLRKLLKSLENTFDDVLIDCPAGLERGFRNVLSSGSDEFILLVTPDDLCVRDAERAAAVMEAKKLPRPMLVVNRLDAGLVRSGEMYSARVIADVLDLKLLGEIPEDPAVYRAVLRHKLLMCYDCPARSAILRIAERLQGKIIPLPAIGCEKVSWFTRFFRRDAEALKEVVPIDSH